MVPPGYERLLLAHAVAVARPEFAAGIRRCLHGADGTRPTLYEYAARQTTSRALQGRGTAYAMTLPLSRERVVVRHNRHGGAFAPVTRDLFLAPTRAPYELRISIELEQRGVPTPQIVAYVLYPPAGLLQRADVCSREIADSRDFGLIMSRPDATERAPAIQAAARLVAALARAGARHHDLNAKNILLTADIAYVLDVDRVVLGAHPKSVLEANLARLTRSLHKSRTQFGAKITDDEIAELERLARQELRQA
jgi:tRNA A-37 threonylcarbamoyl transferase component Bud32